MSRIRANTNQFESTASEVDKYLIEVDKKMKDATMRIEALGYVDYQGDDFRAFRIRWEEYKNGEKYIDMMKSLESYSQFLRFAGAKYKGAQINAINRANGLPRWW